MALLGLHGFTGCDTVSAFHGKGKLLPLRTLLKAPKFIPILGKLGDDWKISEEVVDNLETFVCAMYGANTRTTKVDDLRLTKDQQVVHEGRKIHCKQCRHGYNSTMSKEPQATHIEGELPNSYLETGKCRKTNAFSSSSRSWMRDEVRSPITLV